LTGIERVLDDFWRFGFLGRVQRRGVHVNTLKIGSRGEENLFGGILDFYADLRRELFRRNLKMVFFEVLFGSPRGLVRRGGY
jgi:hypothetical protein